MMKKEPQLAFHPWIDLGEELEARGWTQSWFANVIGVSVPALNAIIKGRRNITPALAVRIWAAFGTSAEVWMNMQIEYDIYIAEQEEKERINSVYEKVKEHELQPVCA